MFVFLCLFTLCSFIVFFIVFAFKSKEITTIKKKKTRENKFENKSKNVSHTGFIWIIKTRNKVSMLQRDDELGWCNYIMFYRRRSAFCTVWINSETFTHAVFLTHANHVKMLWTHATDAKISTYATHVTHAKILWTTRYPLHPRQNLSHATHEPTHPRYPCHPHDLADFFFNIDPAYTDFLLTKLLRAKR